MQEPDAIDSDDRMTPFRMRWIGDDMDAFRCHCSVTTSTEPAPNAAASSPTSPVVPDRLINLWSVLLRAWVASKERPMAATKLFDQSPPRMFSGPDGKVNEIAGNLPRGGSAAANPQVVAV
ncbi:MAG: hypothetical protein KJ587_17210 [Alphaproteobacteria bacterium]|nr:hypothetical protein [Alphaproteobacteria bacterium]